MEARATEAGLATILCNTRAAAFREADYVHMLLDRRVDGMIFIACEMTTLAASTSTTAACWTRARGSSSSTARSGSSTSLPSRSTSVIAGFLATRAPDRTRAHPNRVRRRARRLSPHTAKAPGVSRRSEKERLSPDGLVAHGEFTLEGGRASARALLGRPDRPTAVICSSDVIAIGVLQVARELRLRVPADLSVVGFDGIEAAAWVQPELTTIEQPIDEIASTAVDLLRTVIAEPTRSMPRVLVQPRLRAGGSTAAPAPF